MRFLPEDCIGQEASNLLAERLEIAEPCLIARIGSNELGAMATHLSYRRRETLHGWVGQKAFSRFHTKFWNLYWDHDICSRMHIQAGFFPPTVENLQRFAECSISCARDIDIYASWRHEEDYLKDCFRSAKVIPLNDLAPFQHDNPWTRSLAGRKVLVIHPFSESIEHNYSNSRQKLFDNPDVLPEFDLKTIRAVQTSAGATSLYKDWFEALEQMKSAMDAIDYDIAIVGAGSYALPLAAHAKARGKKGVNLGAFTQLLFGIWGSRWDAEPDVLRFRNKWWTRPLPKERPPKADLVEGACYW